MNDAIIILVGGSPHLITAMDATMLKAKPSKIETMVLSTLKIISCAKMARL